MSDEACNSLASEANRLLAENERLEQALAAANEKVHNLRCDLLHARNQLTLVADQLAAARAEATWPNVIAPPQYDNPAEGWTDPRVPSLIGIWRLAKECGYAVGLHGSLKRDVDLIAAPWTDEAGDPTDLVAKLCVNLPAKKIGEAVFKPQGRIAVTLQLDGWFKPIDLSIMPRLKPPTPGGEHAK